MWTTIMARWLCDWSPTAGLPAAAKTTSLSLRHPWDKIKTNISFRRQLRFEDDLAETEYVIHLRAHGTNMLAPLLLCGFSATQFLAPRISVRDDGAGEDDISYSAAWLALSVVMVALGVIVLLGILVFNVRLIVLLHQENAFPKGARSEHAEFAMALEKLSLRSEWFINIGLMIASEIMAVITLFGSRIWTDKRLDGFDGMRRELGIIFNAILWIIVRVRSFPFLISLAGRGATLLPMLLLGYFDVIDMEPMHMVTFFLVLLFSSVSVVGYDLGRRFDFRRTAEVMCKLQASEQHVLLMTQCMHSLVPRDIASGLVAFNIPERFHEDTAIVACSPLFTRTNGTAAAALPPQQQQRDIFLLVLQEFDSLLHNAGFTILRSHGDQIFAVNVSSFSKSSSQEIDNKREQKPGKKKRQRTMYLKAKNRAEAEFLRMYGPCVVTLNGLLALLRLQRQIARSTSGIALLCCAAHNGPITMSSTATQVHWNATGLAMNIVERLLLQAMIDECGTRIYASTPCELNIDDILYADPTIEKYASRASLLEFSAPTKRNELEVGSTASAAAARTTEDSNDPNANTGAAARDRKRVTFVVPSSEEQGEDDLPSQPQHQESASSPSGSGAGRMGSPSPQLQTESVLVHRYRSRSAHRHDQMRVEYRAVSLSQDAMTSFVDKVEGKQLRKRQYSAAQTEDIHQPTNEDNREVLMTEKATHIAVETRSPDHATSAPSTTSILDCCNNTKVSEDQPLSRGPNASVRTLTETIRRAWIYGARRLYAVEKPTVQQHRRHLPVRASLPSTPAELTHELQTIAQRCMLDPNEIDGSCCCCCLGLQEEEPTTATISLPRRAWRLLHLFLYPTRLRPEVEAVFQRTPEEVRTVLIQCISALALENVFMVMASVLRWNSLLLPYWFNILLDSFATIAHLAPILCLKWRSSNAGLNAMMMLTPLFYISVHAVITSYTSEARASMWLLHPHIIVPVLSSLIVISQNWHHSWIYGAGVFAYVCFMHFVTEPSVLFVLALLYVAVFLRSRETSELRNFVLRYAIGGLAEAAQLEASACEAMLEPVLPEDHIRTSVIQEISQRMAAAAPAPSPTTDTHLISGSQLGNTDGTSDSNTRNNTVLFAERRADCAIIAMLVHGHSCLREANAVRFHRVVCETVEETLSKAKFRAMVNFSVSGDVMWFVTRKVFCEDQAPNTAATNPPQEEAAPAAFDDGDASDVEYEGNNKAATGASTDSSSKRMPPNGQAYAALKLIVRMARILALNDSAIKTVAHFATSVDITVTALPQSVGGLRLGGEDVELAQQILHSMPRQEFKACATSRFMAASLSVDKSLQQQTTSARTASPTHGEQQELPPSPRTMEATNTTSAAASPTPHPLVPSTFGFLHHPDAYAFITGTAPSDQFRLGHFKFYRAVDVPLLRHGRDIAKVHPITTCSS